MQDETDYLLRNEANKAALLASVKEFEGRMKAAKAEPPPSESAESALVIDFVIEDLEARAMMGEKKYGTGLKTHNGRSALWDAYQEALDLVMYLRQALLELEEER